jgi:uncharacterized membrane protein
VSRGRVRLGERIKASPETIFVFLTDLRRVPEWDTRVESVTQMTRGALRPGVILRTTLLVAGERVHADDEITDFDPPTRLGLRSVLGGTDEVSYTLSEEEDGFTRVDVVLAYDLVLPADAGVEEASVRQSIETALRQVLRRLKELIEDGEHAI